ncbi:2864_t:CDS:2, partial [Dentiscutata heterogama]
MAEKRKRKETACEFCRGQKKRCEGGIIGEDPCENCGRKGKSCSYLENSSKSDPSSHNYVLQLQTNKSPEFLSAGDISQMRSDYHDFGGPLEVANVDGDILQTQVDESSETTNVGGDILQTRADFDGTNVDGDILQTDFDGLLEVTNVDSDNLQTQANLYKSPGLASIDIDVSQFRNGFELTNTDGNQSEISLEYVNSLHKTNIHQVMINNDICKASQVIQQLSCLNLILSKNQNMQSQMLWAERLDNLHTTLDSYSSYFGQLL